MHINNKHKNQTQKSGKTMLSSQGPQWSRHYVAGARRRGEYSTFKTRKCVWYLSGKCGETRKYCLLLEENGMGVAT
jgi:hypothetical protein